jgi:signal transduction histidine kinase
MNLALALAAPLVVVYAASLIWARKRSRLAMRRSFEGYAAELLRAHRDALDASNQRLERSNRELLEARAQAEMRTQLVVHDLKNPLTVVITNIGAVQKAIARVPGLAAEAEDLRIARSEALRLSEMIGDLLIVSRLERGDLETKPAAVRVEGVLAAVAQATGVQSGAKQVRMELDVPTDLVAWVDAPLVRRLVENLVSNALRYTPPGGRIQLTARGDSGSLRLAVRNTGTPISETARERLFQKYSTHGSLEPHNCGLGLYLCRLVAEAHGGRIMLADRDGWTVSFEAEMPLSAGAS